MTNNVKNISITGAAGNIAYSALFRIASGELYGKDTKINFKLIDISDFEKKMFGVKLELLDCAFPLLNSVEVTSDLNKRFGDADCIFLFGAKPRGSGNVPTTFSIILFAVSFPRAPYPLIVFISSSVKATCGCFIAKRYLI